MNVVGRVQSYSLPGLGYHDPVYTEDDTPPNVQTMGPESQGNNAVLLIIVAVVLLMIANSEE